MEIINLKRQTTLKPDKGRLLIAEPSLADPSFARTVVLLCEHGPEGTIGFILNRPSPMNIGDLLPELYNPKLPVFEGGPVQHETMHMLHNMPEIMGGLQIANGVYWGGSYNNLSNIVHDKQASLSTLRLFVGYAGWEAGQLEAELAQGAWLVADNYEGLVFETKTEDMWRNSIRSLGSDFAYLINVPMHPQLN